MNEQLTPGDLAEQAGNNTIFTALEAMRGTPTQAGRMEILEDALIDLFSTSAGRERALGGFVAGLIATIDHGLGVDHG